jgi:hypothetical protein
MCRIRASGLRSDLLDRGRELLFLAAGQHDPPTETRHLARNRKPDPRGPTGDDPGAPLERFLWQHSDDSRFLQQLQSGSLKPTEVTIIRDQRDVMIDARLRDQDIAQPSVVTAARRGRSCRSRSFVAA